MPIIYTLSRKNIGGLSEVHVRFYNGRACDLRARTRIYVPVSCWNATEGRCSISRRYETPENAKARQAQKLLDELADRIVEAYAMAGGIVSKAWLQKVIDNETDEQPLSELVDIYCETKHLAPRTLYKLHAFRRHLILFEKEAHTCIYAHTISVEQIRAHGRLFPFVTDVNYNRSIRYALKAAGINRPVMVRNARTGKYEPHPLCDVASSHLARRTFTQMAYATTGDQRLVSSMTGHVPHSKAFERYSEVTRDMKKKALGIK